MNAAACGQFVLFLSLLLTLALGLGPYVARVFTRRPTWLDRGLIPIERQLLRWIGPAADHEMAWGEYASSFVGFTLLGSLVLFVLLCGVRLWPGGPEPQFLTTPMTLDLALNTAASFATTTTWQAYAGESTLPYLLQLVGLTAQNFLAGAAGLAVGIAFVRGFARSESGTLGNFWQDLVRAMLWVLLPGALAGSAFLVSQGVPMNFDPYTHVTTLEGGSQLLAQGPVAALEFIKNLGTNGGGFFNANGAHPYATPTPLVEFVAMLAIAALPAAMPVAFGRMTGQRRMGLLLLGVMGLLFALGLVVCQLAEAHNPLFLEGKEVRFGLADSVLAAITTSNGATGSYAAMADSFTPLGSLVLLVNMLLGECVFGGLGTGLYSLLMYALLGVFITGLLAGRTPEFLGKRLGAQELKPIALYVLIMPLAVLLPTALAISTTVGLAGLTTNPGVHGLTEILFAYASSAANNGQTMASLNANSVFYNLTTAVVMEAGRLGLAVPALYLAGCFSTQLTCESRGQSVSVDTVGFGVIIVVTVMAIGALTYFPVLALGPLAEHFAGR